MLLALLLSACLSSAPCDSRWSDAAPLALAGAADLWSTGYALGRNPNARELQPLGGEIEQRVALKIAGVVVATELVHRIGRRDRKAAKWLKWGIVAAWSLAAVNNVAQAHRR